MIDWYIPLIFIPFASIWIILAISDGWKHSFKKHTISLIACIVIIVLASALSIFNAVNSYRSLEANYLDLKEQNDSSYETGSQDGYNVGYEDGYSEGHEVGYYKGYDNGYKAGYADGRKINLPSSFSSSSSNSHYGNTSSAVTSYIGNSSTKIFHFPDCSYLPLKENQVTFSSRSSAINNGYSPCAHCNP